LKNKQEDIMNQKLHEHKMVYVRKVNELLAENGPLSATVRRAGQYSEICEAIVQEILQVPVMPYPNAVSDRLKKFE
jgi:hypothetical protein